MSNQATFQAAGPPERATRCQVISAVYFWPTFAVQPGYVELSGAEDIDEHLAAIDYMNASDPGLCPEVCGVEV